MALTTLTGPGMLWPGHVALYNSSTGMGTAFTIDAATEIGAFIGRVWWPDRTDTSKDISHIHFRCGAVGSFNAASQYRVSLQDVSLTAGPPIQPDGGVDQSFTSAAGVGPTASAWNRVALNASRTVTPGELLAVVFDYAAFTSTTSIIIQAPLTMTTGLRPLQTDTALYTGSWASTANVPMVVLEFSDGTFGTFQGSAISTTSGARAFNSGSTGSGSLTTGDERGMEWVQQITCMTDGCTVDFQAASGADVDVVLYEGTTPLETVRIDSNAIAAAAATRRVWVTWTQQRTLTAATTYRLMLKPATANNVTLNTFVFNDAAHAVLMFGSNVIGNSRTDGGSFGAGITTEIPVMALSISAIDNGAGGGGGATAVGYIG